MADKKTILDGPKYLFVHKSMGAIRFSIDRSPPISICIFVAFEISTGGSSHFFFQL